MSKAQNQSNYIRSQYKCETDEPAIISADINNDIAASTGDSSTTLPSEVLDIARLLAKIAVDNYFFETIPNKFA